ncbi:hypothetical protein [Streptomyces xanthophaeus]|uniref:hypothetical protein n=1 Tax=Streptomyces xanthophaeus TaxID=67385 RepID=UPI002647F04D|nr:hypothetical protein [Streptomyces xanthophaeus]WKD31717.1 hypothetical protein KO717_06970 [Streptomyces xanthophaeus]
MSFDLGFWWEEHLITPAEAARKYNAMVEGDTGVGREHPALGVFYGELISQFPDLTEENFEVSPWAASLYRTSECVIVSISYPRQREVSDYLLGLAGRSGITCYDPQSEKVYFPEGENPATLELSNGSVINGPSRDDVTRAVSGLSLEDWYVILETRPGWFIQVGLGVAAGAPAGFYALEIREGAKDKHFRAVVEDLPQVINAFSGFLLGDSSWQSAFQFSRVSY